MRNVGIERTVSQYNGSHTSLSARSMGIVPDDLAKVSPTSSTPMFSSPLLLFSSSPLFLLFISEIKILAIMAT